MKHTQRSFISLSRPLHLLELWLDWISDERKSDKSSTQDGRAALVHLFDRAVQDYLCKYQNHQIAINNSNILKSLNITFAAVEIWLEYVHFTIGYMAEPDGSIDKVRSVFERALMSAGLHVPKGALLWESYREFEHIVLSGLVRIVLSFKLYLLSALCMSSREYRTKLLHEF